MTAHHTHGGSTTVVETGHETEGPATALFVLIGLVIVGALIWFFAFSGIVWDRGGSGTDINIRNQNPPAQQNNTNTNPQPQPS